MEIAFIMSKLYSVALLWSELEQIQMLLGHAPAQPTNRYVETNQDLVHAPNDSTKLRCSAWFLGDVGPSARAFLVGV